MDSLTTLPLRKKRASQPKTRTGCLTCKARRVKCDEGKPECRRCLQYTGKCIGYIREPLVNRQPPGFKILLPNTQPLRRPPSNRLFNNDQEYRFFERFCRHTVGELTGIRGSELWTRVVLQATQSDETVRHAATALGALDFTVCIRKTDKLDGTRKQFAYSEYQKAIVGMRKSMMEKECDIRVRLITCILFACFEAYHGNSETAVTQLFAGIEMMEEYTKRRKEPQKALYQARLPPVDEDLEQSFTLLEIQASAWGDERSADLHFERMQNCASIVETMPAEFRSIKDAGYYLSKNMLRGIHLRFSQTNRQSVPTSIYVPPFLGLDTCTTGPAVSEMSRVLAKFAQWGVAFEPLYQKSRSPSGKHLQKGATLLKMHHVGSILWVASGSPGAHRAYTKELTEIVELSKVLISLLSLGPFSLSPLDMVIVLPLAVVGWNYRHRALRREVIDIFSSMVRRETIWDSGMIGKIMEWMAEIEEEGLGDDEYVPEDVVANIANLKVDESQRTVVVTCLQGIKGAPGETVLKQATLHW